MKSLKSVIAAVTGSLVFGVLTLSATFAAAYPDRPIDLIVPWGAGGGADKFARTLTPELEKILKIAVPVSNTPGAAGNTGLGRLISVPADGYSFAVMTGVTFATFPSGVSPYKIDDFDWLIRTQITPSMLFVPKDSRFKSFAEVQAYAKKNPGKLKVAHDGIGGPGDLSLRYLAAHGIKTVGIPFDKPAERYTAPLGGHVDLLYEEPGDVREFLVSNRLRPILIFDKKRFPGYANVPTTYELGYQAGLYNWRGFVMKKGNPKVARDTLSSAIRKALASSKWKEFCEKGWTCDTETPADDAFKTWVSDQFRQLKTFSEKY